MAGRRRVERGKLDNVGGLRAFDMAICSIVTEEINQYLVSELDDFTLEMGISEKYSKFAMHAKCYFLFKYTNLSALTISEDMKVRHTTVNAAYKYHEEKIQLHDDYRKAHKKIKVAILDRVSKATEAFISSAESTSKNPKRWSHFDAL